MVEYKETERSPAFLTYNLLRYVLISYHGYYTYIYSRLNILIMVGVVWAFSFGMILPPLLEVWGTLALTGKHSLVQFSSKFSYKTLDIE